MLKFLNKFILQFFFLRLTKCSQRVITKFTMDSISLVGNNAVSAGGKVDESFQEYWYSIQFFVIPFSGYGRDFKYLGKCNFIRISPKYIKYL